MYLELATLLSQSYFIDKLNAETSDYTLASRIISQPLFAPSCITRSNLGLLLATGFDEYFSNPTVAPVYEDGGVTELPEGNIEFTKLLNVTTSSNASRGYTPQKLPFEALYKPSAYFNTEYVTGSFLYDKFYQLTAQAGSPSIGTSTGPLTPDLRGTKLYEFAIDNFLCETVEFFNDSLTSIKSRREDEFASVVSGNVYQMRMKFYRPLTTGSGSARRPEVDRAKFDMYTRVSAFGWPLAAGAPGAASRRSGSFSHLTSPAYAGKGTVTFTYTASANGQPSLDEIFADTTLSFSRDETVTYEVSIASVPDHDPRMQMDSCLIFGFLHRCPR